MNDGFNRLKPRMDARRVAIVGGGISGVAAAHRLADTVDVTLFESERRLGGHTDSHSVWIEDKVYTIDTGFVAFHPSGHASFCEWLTQIGVPVYMTLLVKKLAADRGADTESKQQLESTRAENTVMRRLIGTLLAALPSRGSSADTGAAQRVQFHLEALRQRMPDRLPRCSKVSSPARSDSPAPSLGEQWVQRRTVLRLLGVAVRLG